MNTAFRPPPTHVCNIFKIANFQHLTTKLAPTFWMFLNEVRLAMLGLFSMKKIRLLRGDLIEVFKILRGKVHLGLVNPITALFNRTLVDGIPADWKKLK